VCCLRRGSLVSAVLHVIESAGPQMQTTMSSLMERRTEWPGTDITY